MWVLILIQIWGVLRCTVPVKTLYRTRRRLGQLVYEIRGAGAPLGGPYRVGVFKEEAVVDVEIVDSLRERHKFDFVFVVVPASLSVLSHCNLIFDSYVYRG
jgi:hypothetical protein